MSEINKILQYHNFKFKHQLGQNFIFDTNLLNSIVSDSGIDKDTTVIEIGAGAGALTKALAIKAKNVIALEVDEKLIPILKDYLKDYDNIKVINRDILKITDKEINALTVGPFKVVANLPYYITSQIIMKFIESDLNCISLTVMVQKEVADRLIAKSGTKNYGAISVAVQIVSDVTLIRYVSRKLFYPVPNVDSAIIKIDINRNKHNILYMSILKKLIKSAFHMRRKTLINNLIMSFNTTREDCIKWLNKANIDTKIRGEALNISQFIKLANIIGGEI